MEISMVKPEDNRNMPGRAKFSLRTWFLPGMKCGNY
jgi:hypothetical protein